MIRRILLGLGLNLAVSTSHAVYHPACANNDVCDLMVLLINVQGGLCYRVVEVKPLGGDRYRVMCEKTSSDSSMVIHTVDVSS